MIEIKNNRLVSKPICVKKLTSTSPSSWGDIHGDIKNQKDLFELLITDEERELINQIENKADKSEIPSLTGYATESWVNSQGFLKQHQSLAGYATQVYVDERLEDLEDMIPSLTGYATQDWVESQGYIKTHQDLSRYALKSEIPSLTGYATQSWVESRNYLTSHQTLKTINGESILGTGNIEIKGGESGGITMDDIEAMNFATESWVESKGYLTQHQSLTGYATQSWVNSQGFLKQHQSLADYALKSEIPSLTGYATQSWVNSQGFITSGNFGSINGSSIAQNKDFNVLEDNSMRGESFKCNLFKTGQTINLGHHKDNYNDLNIGEDSIFIKVGNIYTTKLEVTPTSVTINNEQVATQTWVNNIIGDIEAITNEILS